MREESKKWLRAGCLKAGPKALALRPERAAGLFQTQLSAPLPLPDSADMKGPENLHF